MYFTRNKKITIITICYNAIFEIEKTIISLIEQSYKPIEYIIIDGGSKDGTIDIIKHYKDKISYWISEPDNGIYDAMNKGLKKATGDYVWFLNAGDTFYNSDTVQNLVTQLKDQNNTPDIIYGETAIVDQQQKFVRMRRLKTPENLTWKSFRMGMLVCHQSFIVKREIIPLYNTEYKFSADYDWCIQCLKKAKNIYNSHMILSNFLEEGMTTANRKESLKERYQIMCKYYGPLSTFILHGWFAVRFYSAKWFRGRV